MSEGSVVVVREEAVKTGGAPTATGKRKREERERSDGTGHRPQKRAR
jgi:hypothetical protein